MSAHSLDRLAATISSRRTASPDGSYTRQLLDGGPTRTAKKFGEEAIELALAAAAGTREEVTAEAADVLYHLLVLLASRDVALADVLSILDARTARSGIAEKAARSLTGSP